MKAMLYSFIASSSQLYCITFINNNNIVNNINIVNNKVNNIIIVNALRCTTLEFIFLSQDMTIGAPSTTLNFDHTYLPLLTTYENTIIRNILTS